MTRRSGKRRQSDANHEEAVRIARGTQRPGQTKEQTRLIAQGIKKGIEKYKKQQSAKARELDKRRKKAGRESAPAEEPEMPEKVIYRQHPLPWVLLVLTWVAVAAYWLVYT